MVELSILFPHLLSLSYYGGSLMGIPAMVTCKLIFVLAWRCPFPLERVHDRFEPVSQSHCIWLRHLFPSFITGNFVTKSCRWYCCGRLKIIPSEGEELLTRRTKILPMLCGSVRLRESLLNNPSIHCFHVAHQHSSLDRQPIGRKIDHYLSYCTLAAWEYYPS